MNHIDEIASLFKQFSQIDKFDLPLNNSGQLGKLNSEQFALMPSPLMSPQPINSP